MTSLRPLAPALLLLIVLVATCTAQQNWTRFRGPNGSGIGVATGLPSQWDESDYQWQTRLPGEGLSSPVVYGDRLFVTSADLDAGQRFVVCLNAHDGRQLWREVYPFQKHPKHKNNTFATNTPAVDADHLYVLWQSTEQSTLTALNHDGQKIWRRDLGPFRGGHGPGTSPIVFQDKVIICNDHEGDSYLLAVDRRTGETRWRIERSGQRACYSTPCVFEPKGRPAEIIFTHSYQGITAVDANSGKQTWQIAPFGTFKQRAVGSPIIAGELVIGSSGFTTAERNVVAVRSSVSDQDFAVQEAYRVTRLAPHIPTPLAFQNWLFLWDDRGIVACLDSQSGDTIWQKRVGGNFFGSPVYVDGRLFCMDRDGVVVVLSASDQFEVLGRTQLGEETCSTPALANNTIYFRTLSHIFALSGS